MTATPVRLRDLAKTIRSKNAGPFRLTFDVLFEEAANYTRVRDSGAVTEASIAKALRIVPSQISSMFWVDMALGLKVTLFRSVDQGAIGETDSYGCQQHVPLMNIEIPD